MNTFICPIPAALPAGSAINGWLRASRRCFENDDHSLPCDAVTRCNQLMYPTKSDKSPFASWLSTFCSCLERRWGHKAATVWTGPPQCIVGHSTCSLVLSSNEKTSIPRLTLSFYLPHQPKMRAREKKKVFDRGCMRTTLRETKGFRCEQLVPGWASDELRRDVSVEVICLLWGGRENVEKSAPSQLLQGVLQCRGLTGKVEGKKGSRSAHSLPPLTNVPHSRSPTTAVVLHLHFSTTRSIKFIWCSLEKREK